VWSDGDADADLYSYSDCNTYSNAHRYGYSKRDCDSHSHSDSYGYFHAKTNAYAEVCAHSQTSSYTGAEAIEFRGSETF
jgi:hypothetical protein